MNWHWHWRFDVTGPVATPVVFSVAGLAGTRQELALCGTIPRSRRFREGFLDGDVFHARDVSRLPGIVCCVPWWGNPRHICRLEGRWINGRCYTHQKALTMRENYPTLRHKLIRECILIVMRNLEYLRNKLRRLLSYFIIFTTHIKYL